MVIEVVVPAAVPVARSVRAGDRPGAGRGTTPRGQPVDPDAKGGELLAGRRQVGHHPPPAHGRHDEGDGETEGDHRGARRDRRCPGQIHGREPTLDDYRRSPRIIRLIRSHRSLTAASAPSEVGW